MSSNNYSLSVPIMQAVNCYITRCEADPSRKDGLKCLFEQRYKAELEKLWNRFFIDETLRFLDEKYPGLLGTPISDLGLSTRTFDALFGYVSTVRELLQYSPGEYCLFPGIGPVGCMEIRRGLECILNRFGVSEISME